MIPRHLALIPDGNRRWARARGLGPSEGHTAGIAAVGRVMSAAWAAGVETVTFWWGSPANLTLRAPGEVEGILRALVGFLEGEGAARVAAAGARFEAIGRIEDLCPQILPACAAMPRGPGPRRLVLLMAYDGREELQAAAESFARSGARGSLGEHLWTAHLPPVDLLIRTGGQPHLSAGFLAWGLAEAQLCFSPTLWPDFEEEALARALADYAASERRFGR